MPTTFSQDLMKSTYKDDFSDSSGFKRILFNPRRALQARELTQSQTIIQKDIERFGRNIFKEGAMVNPGGITINSTIDFVKLQASVLDGPATTFPATTTAVAGAIFTGLTSGVSAEIISVENGDGTADNPPTLYVIYRSAGGGAGGISSLKYQPNETIQLDGGSTQFKVQNVNTVSNPAIGNGVRISVSEGDYFTQGFFCFAAAQSIIISKYSNSFTGIIGFKVIQDIVTASDDEALFDNQGAFPNIAAPGADRFRIRLTLCEKPATDGLDTFVYIANIVNSIVVEQATGFNQYNKINDLIAQRTSEESGDYVVDPFLLTYDSATDSGLSAVLSPGKAYVNGHRVNRPVPELITVQRALSTNAISGVTLPTSSIGAEYGSYVVVSAITGALPMDGNGSKTTYPTVEIHNNTTPNSTTTTIGTCRVRHVDSPAAFGSNYRLFIFDVVMSGSNNFRDAKTLVFGSDDTHFATLVLENSVAVIKEANDNNLFFEIPYKRVKTITDLNQTVIRKFTGTSSGSGTLTISLGAAGETFTNSGDWIIMANGSIVAASPGSIGTNSNTISGLGNNVAVEALVYVSQTSGVVIRTKTLTSKTATITMSGSAGSGEVALGQNDIAAVTVIKAGSSSGADISDQFIVDNGQRDGFYDQGKLIQKSTSTISGNIYVEFTYYQHTAGDAFAANSYPAPYGSIPSYTMRNGTVVQLRDVLDYRSAKKADGTFDDVGGASGGVVNELPQNDTLITGKVEYYFPRQDRIILGEDGVIQNLQGTPSDTPKLPELPPKKLELYRTSLNGGTISLNDMSVKFIENKGYTMKDIGKIDKRVDLLEETVALSLLELDTNALEVLDSSGNNRTKSGFLVDNFKNQFHSDVDNQEYRAAINPKSMTLHPGFTETNVGLIYDDAQSSNTTLVGDNVYIDYTDSSYISQIQASRTENVNPFMLSVYIGSINLSPQSDEWKVDKMAAAKVIDGGTKLNLNQAQLFDQSEWGWSGTDLEGLDIGDETQVSGTEQTTSSAFLEASGRWTRWGFDQTTSAIVNRVVASETIRVSLGTKIIDIAVIPFMRSRKVSFEAVGLRPNTRHYPYFNNVKIDDFVRSSTNFDRINSIRTEFESPNLLTAHPDGAGTLVSSGAGLITGTFFIPNNSTTKFRTGNGEFRLLDVTETVKNGGNPGSTAVATYAATGHIETYQEEILSTRHLTVVGERVTTSSNRVQTGFNVIEGERGTNERADPLAQSFYIPQPEGIFTTKVDLFFKTKSSSLPVWIEIRPLVNGYPAANTIVPGSRKYLTYDQVNISDDATVATTFTFNEPIYLSGNTEYAIVCVTDNTDYQLWISRMGDFELGSTARRITKQPFLGSFFKSQNSTTWEADQKEDMKFTLYRARFETTGTREVCLKNNDLPLSILSPNPFITTASSTIVRVMHHNHNLFVGDNVTIAGAGTTAVGTITQTQLNKTHTITAIDPTGYKFDANATAGNTITASNVTADTGGGSSVTATKNIQGSTVYPILQVITPSKTTLSATGKFYSGYSNVALETPYTAPAEGYRELGLNQKNYYDNPVMVANAPKEASMAGQPDTASVKLALTTTSDFVSPVIDLQRASLVLTKNEIDYPIGSTTNGRNVVFDYAAETTPFSGSALAKHITKPITLTNTAVGIKILLAANRPTGSVIEVYHKTGTEDTILSEINWTLATLEQPVSVSDNKYTYKEYEYLIGGINGVIPAFTTFQLKIVFYATNNSKVPTVKDLRVIALGV